MRKNLFRTGLALAGALLFVIALCSPAFGAIAARHSAGSGAGHGLGMRLSRPDPSRRGDPGRLSTGLPMADSIDLSADAPPIGDQGAHSSCVGWSTGYYAKSWYEKREHPSWDLNNQQYQFSSAFVYNQINGGHDNGASIGDALQLLQSTGDCDRAEFPYDSNYTRQPDSTDIAAAGQYKISSSWRYFFSQSSWAHDQGYPYSNDISGVKSRLNSGKPVVMGIPIYGDFPDYDGNPSSLYYTSADSYSPSDFAGGHAVFIAGYDDNINPGGATVDTRGGFLLLNSWGSGWNFSGRVWISYKFAKMWVPEAWYFDDLDSTPAISAVSPASGGPNGIISLTGNNFGAYRRSAELLFQGGAVGKPLSWNNNEVQVRVPNGARTGSIHLLDWDGESSNGMPFTVGEASPSWLLAEGATWPGFDEWVLIQNPNSTTSSVSVVFMTPQGRVPGPSLSVPARSRTNIHVNDYVPNQDVSTAIYVNNGVQVGAERAMYMNAPDGKWGSHDSIGAASTSESWYLAEGATWEGFDEWVLVLNPGTESVQAGVTFQTPDGQVAGPTLDLPPRTRRSVHVNDYLQNKDVSTLVRSLTPGRGVVAERSMYMNTPDGKIDCHNSIGATQTAAGWGLAEGATWPGYEEWVLVQNPTGTPATADFFFLTPKGVREGPVQYVAPGARVSVRVNDYLPDADVSTLVFTEQSNQKVVVERAMYIAATDGKLGAHNAAGSVYQSNGWYLPEGCTWPGFDEWVLVMNPDPQNSVGVQLTFMTPNGVVNGPHAGLAPASRQSFHVNDYYTGDVSTKVESDGYVVCERSMYMNRAYGKAGATCSLGMLASYLAQQGGGYSTPIAADQISQLKALYRPR